MENLLEVIGEHVRKLYFRSTTSEGIYMVRSNCRNVTHLISCKGFCPDYYFVDNMPNLQYLELSPDLGRVYVKNDDEEYYAYIQDAVYLLTSIARIKN